MKVINYIGDLLKALILLPIAIIIAVVIVLFKPKYMIDSFKETLAEG